MIKTVLNWSGEHVNPFAFSAKETHPTTKLHAAWGVKHGPARREEFVFPWGVDKSKREAVWIKVVKLVKVFGSRLSSS